MTSQPSGETRRRKRDNPTSIKTSHSPTALAYSSRIDHHEEEAPPSSTLTKPVPFPIHAGSDSVLPSKKTIAITLLVLQNASVSLLTRLSRTPPKGTPLYNPSEAVFVAELLKLSVSMIMLLREQKNLPLRGGGKGKGKSKSRGRGVLWELLVKQRKELIKLSVPAALYATQNRLLYAALSNLDAATYQATYQLKLLTTALFSVLFFGTSLSVMKWVSLMALTIGVATVQLDGISTPSTSSTLKGQTNPQAGLIAILAACISSGIAGVWFESVLKAPSAPPTSPSTPTSASSHSSSSPRSSSPRKPQLRENSPSLWARNVQLSVPSIFFSSFGVLLSPEFGRQSVLRGFTPLVWSVVGNQAIGGLLVAMVVREADSVAKGFATSIALVLSTIGSMVFLGLIPGMTFVLGATMVSAATMMYAMDRS